MIKLNPYIGFDGNCREAMTFYRDCFGGDLQVMTMGESPMASEMPAEAHAGVMHSCLEIGDRLAIMGTDMGGCMEGTDTSKPEGRVSIAIDCTDEAELRRLAEQLAQGGETIQAVEEPFWGGLFGMVRDRYGITWLLTYS